MRTQVVRESEQENILHLLLHIKKEESERKRVDHTSQK